MANEQQLRIGAPYGDIFFVQTPALDRYSMLMYNEQRQRELRAQKETQDLDRLMNMELGKIRAADTPEFIQQYQKYRDMKKQLYHPKIQRNAEEVYRVNQQANEQLAKAMQLANDSIEFKNRQKDIIAERNRKYDYFVDDFNDRMNRVMNTPISKLQDYDFNDVYYKGNVTNLQPKLDKAKGRLQRIGEPEINEGFSPIEREITSFKGANSPRQYYNLLTSSLKGWREQKDLVTSFDFTPQEEQQIIDRYNTEVKNNPRYLKAYGEEQLDFPEWADYSEAGRIAKLLAMEHALDKANLITETKRETKKQEAAEQQQAFKIRNILLSRGLTGQEQVNDVWKSIDESLADMESKGSNWLPASVLAPDAKEVVLSMARNETKNDELNQDDLKIIRGNDGTLRVFDRDDNFVTYLPRVPVNIGKQPGVQEKRAVVAKGEPKGAKFPLPKGKPREIMQNGYKYVWNENTGKYE